MYWWFSTRALSFNLRTFPFIWKHNAMQYKIQIQVKSKENSFKIMQFIVPYFKDFLEEIHSINQK